MDIKETGGHIFPQTPHIHAGIKTVTIMWSVVVALIPGAVFSVFYYGMHVLILFAVCIASAVFAEALIQSMRRLPITAYDGSAVITGILLAMNIPPGAPLWMAAAGSVFAIVIVKQLYGGLGFNIFNPALAACVSLEVAWSLFSFTGWEPVIATKVIFSPIMFKSMPLEAMWGIIGETSAVFFFIGGVFLLVRRIISLHIPIAYLGTSALFFCVHGYYGGLAEYHLLAVFQLLSGGIVLGAFFMATDYTTSPITGKGKILYGIGCGILTCVFRFWGAHPNGVPYAILLMNAVVPLIDRISRPKVLGQ